MFIAIGATKFKGDPGGEWYHAFERIGIGQWFRVATGLIQVLGGMLMVAPQTRTYGASALAVTMVGAAIVDVAVLGSLLVIVPLMLLFLIAAVWASGA